MDEVNTPARLKITGYSFNRSEPQTDMFHLELEAELVDPDELQHVLRRDQKNTCEQYVGDREKFLQLAYRILAELDPPTERILASLARIEKLLENRLPAS